MSHPIAFKLSEEVAPVAHRISLDDAIASRLASTPSSQGPAVLAVSSVAMLEKMSAGIFDGDDVRILAGGDWSNIVLLVMPPNAPLGATTNRRTDSDFIAFVECEAPELLSLAEKLIGEVRAAGIDGVLHLEGHRWVNRPLNTFTLSVQPRVKNFQFTLYGGPDRFGRSDFIKSDQNGYSRGWVKSEADVPEFIRLASIAHERKRRR